LLCTHYWHFPKKAIIQMLESSSFVFVHHFIYIFL
jgi:hypothetical protein